MLNSYQLSRTALSLYILLLPFTVLVSCTSSLLEFTTKSSQIEVLPFPLKTHLWKSWCWIWVLVYWQLIFPRFLLLQHMCDVVWWVVPPEYDPFHLIYMLQYGFGWLVSPGKSSLPPLTGSTWQPCSFCHLFRASTSTLLPCLCWLRIF